MFKSIVSSVALAGAAALLSTGASAEGLPSRGSVGSAPAYTWTGFYVGLNAGRAWGDAGFSSKADCPDQAGNCLIPDADNLGFVGALGTGGAGVDGFTGGIQVGYNRQVGDAVFGIEADFNAFNLRGSVGDTVPAPFSVNGLPTETLRASLDTEWLATVRARAGVTLAPRLLGYVTGGLALTEVNVKNSFSLNDPVFPESGSSSHSSTRAGWTIGAGFEYALGGNWSLKGEYLYMDFGSVSTKSTISPAPELVDQGVVPNTLGTSADLTAQIVRAGLNYKF
jgi:outer membrane immunogenic protein